MKRIQDARARTIIAALKADPTVSIRRLREIIPPDYHRLIPTTPALPLAPSP